MQIDFTKYTAGVILCGGQSSRMGFNKAFATLNGRPLIGLAIEKMKVYFENLYISANTNEYHQYGYPVIADIVEDAGPAGGILSCLENVDAKGVFVLSCDMPFIPGKLIEQLLNIGGKDKIVLPSLNSFVQPLCGYYPLAVRGSIRHAIENGNNKMMHFIRQSHPVILELDELTGFQNEMIFFNVNSPDDLKTARLMLEKKA